MKSCAYPYCPNRVSLDVLACREHWLQLPLALRLRVMNSWRPGQTLTTASPEYLDAFQDVMAVWFEACEAEPAACEPKGKSR